MVEKIGKKSRSKKKVNKKVYDRTKRSRSAADTSRRKSGPRSAEQFAEDMRYRREQNRAQRSEELRSKFKVSEYIRQLEQIDKDLAGIFKQIANKKRLTKEEYRAVVAKLHVIREKKDLNFKRIAKVLGDVKSVELSDPDGKNPFERVVGLFSRAMDDANRQQKPDL